MPIAAYLDSSALLKLVVEEPESWALSDYVGDSRSLSSDLSLVELPRAVRRLGLGSRPLSLAAKVLDGLELLRLDDEILARAGDVSSPALRSLDAIHLASALSLGRELDALVTYDRRLASAAADAGLRVESPS